MANRQTAKRLKSSGMTLLEVMVSFSILALVFIALTITFPLSSSINKTAENATKASYLAQKEIEELGQIGYDNIGIGTIEAKHRLAADPENYLYYFQRQTTASYVDGDLGPSGTDLGLKKITVTLYYTEAISKIEKIYTTVFLMADL